MLTERFPGRQKTGLPFFFFFRPAIASIDSAVLFFLSFFVAVTNGELLRKGFISLPFR